MKVLVLAELSHGELAPSTLSSIQAGLHLHKELDVVLLGANLSKACEALKQVKGVKCVFSLDDDRLSHPLAENMTKILADLASGYTHVLASSSTFGKNVMPRLAASLDVMLISDVTSIISDDTFVRPIYAGNAFATVKSKDAIKLLTIRATAFEKAESLGGQANVEALNLSEISQKVRFVSSEIPELERPELTAARVVVSGGRGLASKDNFKLIESLADKLNAAIGASRAAVDAGFVPNDYQVGQTGKIVAPELYIAIGISGAIQHLAGMKDSKIVVAINKDADAPIFTVADYGLVADLFEVLPQFEQLI